MATDPVTFAFDFVDPGSYLVHELLRRRLGPATAEGVRMLPLELRPPPDPLIRAADEGWKEMTRALGEVARVEGVPFDPPAFVPWTRKAHEIALHAEEKEVGLHGLLFRARFEEGLDLGRVDVLVDIASRAGLDGAEARTVLGVDRFAPRTEDARREAAALRIRGVPTLLAGDGERLEGFRPAEELRSFLATAGIAPSESG